MNSSLSSGTPRFEHGQGSPTRVKGGKGRLRRAAGVLAWFLSASLTGTHTAANAQTILVDQQVAGSRRICTYNVNHRRHSRAVPRGQPCPPTFSRVEPRLPRVPTQAEFVREQRSSNGTNCVYRYRDQEYVHRQDAGASCPRTPALLR